MRCVLLILILIASFLPADIIYFQDDQNLECDVLSITDEEVTIEIKKGTFTFPRDRIIKIEYNYAKKKAMIPEGDFKSHYELGLWCQACGQEDNALVQFLLSTGKEGVPDDAYLKAAEIYMAKNQPGKALNLYREYLVKHPDDALIVAKVAEMTKKPETPAQAKQPAIKKADEGLEILPDWRIEKWANPGTLTPSKIIQAKIENQILKADFQSRNSDKTAIRLQYKTDLSSRKALTFDVFHPGKRPMPVAIAFVTSPTFDWFESKTVMIKPGWNLKVTFDLTKADYKTKATGWNHKSTIKNAANVVQVILLAYNGPRSGSLFFDNIKFE